MSTTKARMIAAALETVGMLDAIGYVPRRYVPGHEETFKTRYDIEAIEKARAKRERKANAKLFGKERR